MTELCRTNCGCIILDNFCKAALWHLRCRGPDWSLETLTCSMSVFDLFGTSCPPYVNE
jgi:hypothetical protein